MDTPPTFDIWLSVDNVLYNSLIGSTGGLRSGVRPGLRKVRTPQGMMLANSQAARADGKCNREEIAPPYGAV